MVTTEYFEDFVITVSGIGISFNGAAFSTAECLDGGFEASARKWRWRSS